MEGNLRETDTGPISRSLLAAPGGGEEHWCPALFHQREGK